ncbi:MAG: hypothetical protein V4627_01750 [Pseudomonadota bacterium]
MAHYDIYSQPLPAKGRMQFESGHPPWYLWLAALLALAALAWWLWPQSPDANERVQTEAPPAQALQSGQAWPFGPGSALPATAAKTDASPWDRVSKTADADEAQGPDPRSRNAAISPTRLAFNHPKKAQAFLDHVVLQPEQRGGFVVESILPGSPYERAGLKPGDTIYSLELPDQPAVDENNMVALTSVQVLAFDVVRYGATVRLSTQLNDEVPDHATH